MRLRSNTKMMNANVGSFTRLILSLIAGYLANRGIEVDDATIEIVAAAGIAIFTAIWSVVKNKRKDCVDVDGIAD